MRARTCFASALLSIGLLCGVVPTARACSSDHPTFDQAIRTATSIARVTFVDQWEPGETDRSQTHHVVETLKGSISGTVHLDDPRSTLCGGDLSGYVGEEAIVAYGVTFSGESLTLGWFMSKDTAAVLWGLRPVTGSTEVPETAKNLDDLAETIRGLLPDTAVAPRPYAWPSAVGSILVAVALGRAVMIATRVNPGTARASEPALDRSARRGGHPR